jgi:hypothetical protein
MQLYFLRMKLEVFGKFKEFKSLVENQIDKRIKELRIDNEGELCGKEFDKFYNKCSIP